MSWIDGLQDVKIQPSNTKLFQSIQGDLDDTQAKIVMSKFFRSNIGLLFNLLTDKDMLPIQEIIIRSMFLRDNGIIVAHRGFSKSWLLGVCSFLIPILSPGCGFCLISSNFRAARNILRGAEKIVNDPKSILLKQCYGENQLRRSNDVYSWDLDNGSQVFALPLNGEGLRGHRATILVIDEGLNVSEEIQENILRPFLAVKQNAFDEMEIRAKENELIKAGVITEKDRISFPNNKFFVFSSASYQFQYLYKLYSNFVENITQPRPAEKEEDKISYFAMRLSYKVLEELPNHAYLDMKQVNAAKANGGEGSDTFQREWMAQFPDISDGYFNIRRLHECSVKFGEEPSLQLRGDKESKYILVIDPAYSDSHKQDYFAMAVYLLNREEKKCYLVHSYTQHGGELRNHYLYLSYILTHFNIVFAVIDKQGNEFLRHYNESTIAKERNLKLERLEVDLESDQPQEIEEEYLKAKNQYNLTTHRILYEQPFDSTSIRKMNEHLKGQIEAKKIWFGSRLSVDDANVSRAQDILDIFKFKNKKDAEFMGEDFLEEQNKWIEETKAQTALIQVKATAAGHLSFDLPQQIRRSSDENKPRKDSYTCLLLAARGTSHYFNIMNSEPRQLSTTFAPIIIH